MTEGGASSISHTSRPRGNYLDPLKACALSGESNVPFGKSESDTFTKFSAISRQIRRNAARVSVLNGVEKSRYDSAVKRIDGERGYQISVLDRQVRQLRRSLTTLEKQRRPIPRCREGEPSNRDSLMKYTVPARASKRTHDQAGLSLPPITDTSEPLKTIEELEKEEREKEESDRLRRERELRLLADDLPDYPARKVQSLPVLDRPGFITQGMPQLPHRFYKGSGSPEKDPPGGREHDIERLPSI